MEFLKKNCKFIVGIIIYTIAVIVITVYAHNSYLKKKISDTLKDTYSEISNNMNIETSSNEISSKQNNQELEKSKELNLNETITTQDWEITFKGTEFIQDVMPPTPDSYYRHYQVKDTNNTYLVVKFDMKNISTLSLKADDKTSLKAIYDGKYEYTGFTTLLSSDNQDFDYTNITPISPLTNRIMYYLVEMPKNITEDDKSMTIELTAYQTKYIYTIK